MEVDCPRAKGLELRGRSLVLRSYARLQRQRPADSAHPTSPSLSSLPWALHTTPGMPSPALVITLIALPAVVFLLKRSVYDPCTFPPLALLLPSKQLRTSPQPNA